MEYIIGTRGSKLALTQTEYVRSILENAYPEHSFVLKVIKTKGDLIQDRPLNQIGDKGLFVTEIENEILDGLVHIGVHSMKDMPAEPAEGLCFTKAWKREDPRDVLILREKKNLSELPCGAVIGTGSLRRQIQLKKIRPDIVTIDIRGNVDTRLRKMEEQKLDGIVLAAAGLHRLGMSNIITQYLEPAEMISAPAQGILALEIRKDNEELLKMLNALSDEQSQKAATAERSFLQLINGSCHVPVGAVCNCHGDSLNLYTIFGTEDGSQVAFAEASGTDPIAIAREAAKEIRKKIAGTVYLVGGGPGDPGLITVRGLQAISEADCIVYDRLSSPELLNAAKPGCEMIYVGKANRNHTMKQDEINMLLVRKAMEHRKVVRLKGGDVYVFGRGGEEGIVLRDHGVPFVVVPGISSSIAGLAYAGIPITHRGVATGFHVVTAHNKQDELADIDFSAMARGKDTCVFLMGLTKLGEIADGLLSAGMDRNTPAAVISSATTVTQKTVTAKLGDIAKAVEDAKLPSPALIVVGNTVNLREKLNFFEERPLFGKKYVIPRIGSKDTSLASQLRDLGADVVQIQVGDISVIRQKLTRKEISEYSWLIFTSQYGVRYFFENLYENGLDTRSLANAKIAVIGAKTAQHLREFGVIADLIPDKSNGVSFANHLKTVINPEDTVCYIKGTMADDTLQAELTGMCHFTHLDVYDNSAVDFESPKEEFDGVLFTSASSAERFLKEFDPKQSNRYYSIGPKCSKALQNLGIKNYIEAEKSDYEGLLSAVINHQ